MRSIPVFAAALALAGCIAGDEDERCGPNQRIIETATCVCVEGAIPDPATGGCMPCGDDEVADGSDCICADGYRRSDVDGSCELTAQGQACDTGVGCDDLDYDYCKPVDGTDGYCTSSGCVTSSDCDSGYSCADGTPTYCRRPPIGLGRTCTGQPDCEGFQADSCLAPLVNLCSTNGCTISPNDCFEGWICCDPSVLQPGAPTICVPPANADFLGNLGASCSAQ